MPYNTGNPVEPNGSSDPRDLFDNSANLDRAVNGDAPTWIDRKGRNRKSLAGMELEFDQSQAIRDEQFQQFLISSGYQDLGDYGPGILITARNQILRKDGEYYRISAAVEVPYTTTGVWFDEASKFVSVGDAALRQELASPTGSEMVIHDHDAPGSLTRSVGDKLRDFASVADFVGVDPTGASFSTSAFLAAQQAALYPWVPYPGRYKIDPANIDVTRLSGHGFVEMGGNYFSVGGIVGDGVMGERKLCTLQFGDGINSPVIYPNAQNALQGVACVRHNGIDKVFISQQVSGGGFGDPATLTRLTEFHYADDGSTLIPVGFTDPLPLSHGSDLSAFVEGGQLYLFTTAPAESSASNGGKGYTKVRWNGTATSVGDLSNYYLVGEPGDSNPINQYQSGTVAVSMDGKLLVGIFTGFYGTGRFMMVWDRKAVESSANPRLVRPLFGPTPIQRSKGSGGSTMQGLACDGRNVYTMWGVSAPGAARTIQVYGLDASLIRSFPVTLAAHIYTDSELRGGSSLGIPVSFEPEGLSIMGDELVCGAVDAWKSVGQIVSYKGFNFAYTATSPAAGVLPTNQANWLKVPLAANAGEYDPNVTYSGGAYTKRAKHLIGVAKVSASKGNAPKQGGISHAPSGTAVPYYAGTDVAWPREQGSFTFQVFDEPIGSYSAVAAFNNDNLFALYDTSFGATSDYVAMRSSFSGSQWGMQLRSRGAATSLGAYLDMISGNSPNGAGEFRLSTSGDAIGRVQVNGVTKFAVGLTDNVLYQTTRFAETNVYSWGLASRVGTTIYLQTAPVVSSDARLKTPVRSMEEREMSVGIRLAEEIGFYKWLCSIDEKGESDARLHAGMTVQRAIEIFESEGLDPLEYGAICHDVWGDEFETVPEVWLGSGKFKVYYDEFGEEVWRDEIMEKWADAAERQTQWAGDKYSFREAELHGLMIRGLSHRQQQIMARLDALESK